MAKWLELEWPIFLYAIFTNLSDDDQVPNFGTFYVQALAYQLAVLGSQIKASPLVKNSVTITEQDMKEGMLPLHKWEMKATIGSHHKVEHL